MTSTLAGLDLAPNHVHWVAEPSFKKADVREVRFYVDGKLSWIDPAEAVHVRRRRRLPRDDVAGARRWRRRLRPRLHPAHVHDRGGGRRRLPGPGGGRAAGGLGQAPAAPPLRHLGKPHRRPALASAHQRDLAGNTVDGARLENATAYEIEADGSTLRILAPIRKGPGGTGVTEFGWHFDSYDCSPAGPFAVYRWSIDSMSRLHLKAVRDQCDARRQKLEGTWAASAEPGAMLGRGDRFSHGRRPGGRS